MTTEASIIYFDLIKTLKYHDCASIYNCIVRSELAIAKTDCGVILINIDRSSILESIIELK
jgi:hypothetical protein